MKISSKILLLAILLISACKTQEDIRREKTMENINEKISQTQQSNANTSTRFQIIEDQVAKLTGSIDELTHNKGQDQKDFLLLKEKVTQLDETNRKQNEYIKQLNEKLNDQTKYIEQVVKSLAELSEKANKEEEPKKKDEKNSTKEATIKSAIVKFKANHLSDAKEILEEQLENKKLKSKDKAMALYYLGLIEFKSKKYEESKVYFSKLFTEYPDSTYNPSALLNLAKTFSLLKSHEEAKQTIEELISRYPKTKEAQEGAKIKSKL
jgi:TolA-binding protein